MLDSREQCTVVLKLKFIRNSASLEEMIGILDLRSLGYYKIRQGVLQQNLSKCYRFESADRLCEEFKALVNELKNDKKILYQEKYPWLEDSDERKYMTDRIILDKQYT